MGDNLYIVMVAVRLEEGKVLSKEEIQRMYQEGKIMFVRATIYGAVLKELSNCEGTCDEKTYDNLSYRAKEG